TVATTATIAGRWRASFLISPVTSRTPTAIGWEAGNEHAERARAGQERRREEDRPRQSQQGPRGHDDGLAEHRRHGEMVARLQALHARCRGIAGILRGSVRGTRRTRRSSANARGSRTGRRVVPRAYREMQGGLRAL